MHQTRRSNKSPADGTSSRGQSTVEFALVLPLVVLCIGTLVTVVTACLTTLRLNDFARLTARTVATSTDGELVIRENRALCTCDIQVTVETGIVTVRAEKPFAFPVLGLPLPVLHLHGESFAMKEPTVSFRAPSSP